MSHVARFWHSEEALCQGMDLSVFFSLGDKKEVRHAKKVCDLCPVRVACREAAIEEEHGTSGFGIRGGLTPRERKALMKERTRLRKLQERRAAKTKAA